MGNFIKTNPVGIDKHIQNLQIAIYDNFKSEWNLTDDDWNSYGRLYRNFDNEGKEYLPFPFESESEYKNPPFFEDTIKLNSFFDILETQKIDTSAQSSMKIVIYFFVDLIKIFGDNGDREDEKITNNVVSFVQQQFSFVLHSKRIGIKTVMKDWSGYTQQKMMSADMQPLFAFALEFEISEYYICYSPQTQYIQPNVLSIPYTRYNPKGIDHWIQSCQINLYNYILTLFNGHNSGMLEVGKNDYNCFGRCYRNWSECSGRDRKYIPQAFVKVVNSGFEYVNILFEDTVKMQSFFDVGETIREGDGLMSYANIHLYFFVNLSYLYSDNTFRNDEEFIILISQFIMENSGFELYQIQRGVKSIMNEYNGVQIIRNSKANMQPFLCFRMDMKKYYDESVGYCESLIPERDYQFNPQEFDPSQFA